MRFHLEHRTTYRYSGLASESFMEARLTPVTDERQRLLWRDFTTQPRCNVFRYSDYFGNAVESFSIIHAHRELVLSSRCEVETQPTEVPRAATDITVAEAKQIFRSARLDLFEFTQPSAAIEHNAETEYLAREFLPPSQPLGGALLALNAWITDNFRYQPGSTQIDSPVSAVLGSRTGVCQDLTQVMIAVLRSGGIPARYVTGYIETDGQREQAASATEPHLIGASESHAWAEVYLPGGFWWPLDPTNRCLVGERHVKVACGRDYHDCTPTRGVFKGISTEELSVTVVMRRTESHD